MPLRPITLEDHFAIPDTLGGSRQYAIDGGWRALEARLLDLGDERIREMDRAGIDLSIVSLNSPAIEAIADPGMAVDVARRANDAAAEAVSRYSDRLRAFASLPMQDPDRASAELTRAVQVLGCVGALANGFSQRAGEVLYYDRPEYGPFWQTVERLGVPFYLHPRDPLPAREPIYEGHPWFTGSAWAFGVETATHALRLMGCGLFDRCPRLTIILGHLGEGLPYNIWRIDHRLAKSPRGIPARRTMTEYLRSNFYLTTSGNFRTPTLLDAVTEIGVDRVMFSIDYPFEEMSEGVDWLRKAEISELDREKIARTNALRLFNLTGRP